MDPCLQYDDIHVHVCKYIVHACTFTCTNVSGRLIFEIIQNSHVFVDQVMYEMLQWILYVYT